MDYLLIVCACYIYEAGIVGILVARAFSTIFIKNTNILKNINLAITQAKVFS